MSVVGRRDLLVEIGTEELPARDQASLALALGKELSKQLAAHGLLPRSEGTEAYRCFYTPRRIAVLVCGVPDKEPDRQIERNGPTVAAAFDADGRPTAAAKGFSRAVGVDVDRLERHGGRLAYRRREHGRSADEVFRAVLPEAFANLPLPKRMRWGDGEDEFLRPVRWLLVRFGRETVPIECFGQVASGQSRGHRVHHPKSVALHAPRDYVRALRAARVLVDPEERRARITEEVAEAARAVGAAPAGWDALYEEITGMVEWPIALAGQFDERFLSLPDPVIVTTLAHHQRFVPLRDAAGKLSNYFVAVVNLESREPEQIRRGLERVVRPRLEDAAFYYRRDCERPLADYAKDLADLAFAPKLGSMADKTCRLMQLAEHLASAVKTDTTLAVRAARLSKCDLATGMVFEFPELQGVIGGDYALASGEDPAVAQAISEQYLPAGPSDRLPESPAGTVLAMADRLDTLVGGFAAGMQPSGTKDPFGLRRSAFGLLRISADRFPELDLDPWLATTAALLPPELKAHTTVPTLSEFLRERLRTMILDKVAAPDVAQAILKVTPLAPGEALERAVALAGFRNRPEIVALASANKRIANILRQATVQPSGSDQMHKAPRDATAAETALREALASVQSRLGSALAARDYASALAALAALREPVDRFFNEVLVMDPDLDVRRIRLALLHDLRESFLKVADIGELQIRADP